MLKILKLVTLSQLNYTAVFCSQGKKMLPRFFAAPKPASLTNDLLLKLLPSYCSGFQLLTDRLMKVTDLVATHPDSSSYDKDRAKKLKTQLQNAGTLLQVKLIIKNCLEESRFIWASWLPIDNNFDAHSLNYHLLK